MTARLLRLLLLLQLAAVAAIGYLAIGYLGVSSPWIALLAGLGAVLLVRLLITANNFVLSACYRSATPEQFRIGPGGRLRMFGEEFMATMLHSSWFMPRARQATRIHADSSAVPVLLLHGYGCNSGYWTHLVHRLDAARVSHATLDLEPVTGDIDEYVPAVAHAVEALCEASGAPAALIVAHSMGGLVARAYLRRHGGARVARVITLGTPHHGTSLANFGLGRNAAQMRRGRSEPAESSWLRALGASESAATRALITSLYTYHDNIVAPQLSSVLPGAHNIAFGGIGHVAMGRNKRILNCVMQEIASTNVKK